PELLRFSSLLDCVEDLAHGDPLLLRAQEAPAEDCLDPGPEEPLGLAFVLGGAEHAFCIGQLGRLATERPIPVVPGPPPLAAAGDIAVSSHFTLPSVRLSVTLRALCKY